MCEAVTCDCSPKIRTYSLLVRIKIANVAENKDNQVSKNILSGKYETGEAIVVGEDGGSSMVQSDNILL